MKKIFSNINSFSKIRNIESWGVKIQARLLEGFALCLAIVFNSFETRMAVNVLPYNNSISSYVNIGMNTIRMAVNVLPYTNSISSYGKIGMNTIRMAVNVLPYNSISSYGKIGMNTTIGKAIVISDMVIVGSIAWKKVTTSNQSMEIQPANPFYKTRDHPLLQRPLRNRMQGTSLGMNSYGNRVQKSCQYLQEWRTNAIFGTKKSILSDR